MLTLLVRHCMSYNPFYIVGDGAIGDVNLCAVTIDEGTEAGSLLHGYLISLAS